MVALRYVLSQLTNIRLGWEWFALAYYIAAVKSFIVLAIMHRNDREKMFQSISKTAKLNMVAKLSNFFSSTLTAGQSKLERLTRQARQGQAL